MSALKSNLINLEPLNDSIYPKKIAFVISLLRNIFEYAIAAILFIQGNTVWITLAPIRNTIGSALYKCLIVCMIFCVVLSLRKISGKELICGAAVILSLALYMGIVYKTTKTNADVYLSFAVMYLIFALYCLISRSNVFFEVLKKYRNIVCAVAVFSLVMWLLCSVFKLIPSTSIAMTSWSDIPTVDKPIRSWFGIYFETQGIRNTSVFTEGPMAALHYSLALLIEMLLSKKPSFITFGILAIAIFSTMTTTGILVVGAICFIYAIIFIHKKGWLKKKAVKISLISVILIGCAAAIAIVVWKVSTVSGSIRSDDMRAGWLAFTDHPIVGNGCNNLPAIQKYMSEWRSFNTGYSSGLLWVLSDGGLLLGALYLCPIICALVKGIMKKQWLFAIFAVSIFIIFLITVFQYSFLLSFISVFLLFWKPEESRTEITTV